MKKNAILFCVGLLTTVFSQFSFAQGTGGLKILNNTKCNVDVTMYAIAPSMPDNCNDIIAVPVSIPMAGGSFSWPDPATFLAYTGGTWAYEFIGPSATAPDFQFLKADFTFTSCSAGVGCTPPGGSIGDATFWTCSTVSATWIGGCGPITIKARWAPTTVTGTGLNNISIEFQ